LPCVSSSLFRAVLFAVHFLCALPCIKFLPCIFLVVHSKGLFIVRAAHGKVSLHGNDCFSGSDARKLRAVREYKARAVFHTPCTPCHDIVPRTPEDNGGAFYCSCCTS
jgi:hypothetical protein